MTNGFLDDASAAAIDTPSVVVDLDRVDARIAGLAAVMRERAVALRPHAKTHKSPVVARWQIDRGAVGICCAKLGEAEALMPHGIDRICMTTANLSQGKIRRAMQKDPLEVTAAAEPSAAQVE